uniref:Leucine rich immune protein (Short) n=1 Tax=Anopheles atroparvus TaxID=41427 RepID=A0A8W7NZT0_ANOAO
MLGHYIVLGYLAYLACPVRTAPESQVAFKCGSKTGPVCTIQYMKFEDYTQAIRITDSDTKKSLNIKAGSIKALTMSHCKSLGSFEKITIGPTGLGELCVSKTFRQVSAENNNIRMLHTTGANGNEDFLLEVLKLNDNKLGSVESMRVFVALKELYLERNVLTTLDMTVFGRMKNLEKLFLGNNRLITTTEGAVELPKLSFFGLANNTLTRLNVRQWDMPSLATLELASNNLTNVDGFDVLTALDKVTLAANSWECLELESMLEALQENAVTIVDADRGCDGIRNTSICCTVDTNPSEQTLLEEMKNYTLLEERYKEATKKFEEQFELQMLLFNKALDEVKKAMSEKEGTMAGNSRGNSRKQQTVCKNVGKGEDQSPPEKPKVDDDDGTESASTTDAPGEERSTDLGSGATENSKEAAQEEQLCESSDEQCICPKKELDTIKEELKALLTRLERSNGIVTAALANQPHLHRMALLTRHEFRTAVKRGEHKLMEVHTKLAMLRDYIDNKLNSV